MHTFLRCSAVVGCASALTRLNFSPQYIDGSSHALCVAHQCRWHPGSHYILNPCTPMSTTPAIILHSRLQNWAWSCDDGLGRIADLTHSRPKHGEGGMSNPSPCVAMLVTGTAQHHGPTTLSVVVMLRCRGADRQSACALCKTPAPVQLMHFYGSKAHKHQHQQHTPEA